MQPCYLSRPVKLISDFPNILYEKQVATHRCLQCGCIVSCSIFKISRNAVIQCASDTAEAHDIRGQGTNLLSLECSRRCFVPVTATGDLDAMTRAVSRAAATTSSLPPSTSFETKPTARASFASNCRAV